MEVVWRGSGAGAAARDVFTGNFASGAGGLASRCVNPHGCQAAFTPCPLLPSAPDHPSTLTPAGNYGPPRGFAFEWADPPIMDDPRMPDEYNVQERCAPGAGWSAVQCGAVRTLLDGPVAPGWPGVGCCSPQPQQASSSCSGGI